MNVPNLLSILRILLIPGFVAVFFSELEEKYTYSIMILLFSGVTDLLDGFIARKFNMTTKLGAVLDPIADKLMQFSVFVCLWLSKMIPLWLVVLLFIKEVVMAIGAFVLLNKRLEVKADASGKISTAVFYVTAFLIIILRPSYTASTALALVALISAVLAMASYGMNFIRVLKNNEENTVG